MSTLDERLVAFAQAIVERFETDEALIAAISAVPVFTAASKGALGDGSTNDTLAFQALSAEVNAAGGGVVELTPGATYVVGLQTFVNSGIYTWQGQSILSLSGCTKPVVIRGNGAKFRVAPGLYFGTFDSNGNPTTHTLPFSSSQACTTAVDGIISVKNCTAQIVIEDIEIDGNAGALNWGGQWGNTGWQLPADLFFITGNTGGVTLRRLYAHHGSRDGLQTLGGTSPGAASGYSDRFDMEDCRFEYNTRNNWSMGSGRGYRQKSSGFKHAGKCPGVPSPGYSAPAANIDLEAFVSGDQIRDVDFINCEMIDAAGVNFLSDGGDVANVELTDCRLIGTSSWALWWVKPWGRFKRCLIGGGVITNLARVLSDGYGTNPACAAPQFEDCTFTDDPTVSPVGALYTGTVGSGAINNGNTDLGLTGFNRCKFRIGYNAYGFSTAGGYFTDCTFDNGTLASSFFAPHFRGQTTITDASSGMFQFSSPPTGKWGSNITYNGTQMRRGTATYDAPSIANGARATTTVSVPWARFRDRVKVTLAESVQGINLGGYVSTAATNLSGGGIVTVTLDNFTGAAVDLASTTLDVALEDRELA